MCMVLAKNKKIDYYFDLTKISNVQRVLLSRFLSLYINGEISRKDFLKAIDRFKLPIIR